MILVTGATGNFGGSTAQYLQKYDIQFRAASRNTRNEPDVASFDWEKPETFTRVLKGITTVSIVPPPVVGNDFHVKLKPFVEAAMKEGVKHAVLTSALYSDHPDSIFYGTEALIKTSGIDYTIIRPSFVFQNFLTQFLEAVRNGVILAPTGIGKTSYVDVRNVGEATSMVLKDPVIHNQRTYCITGGEALTHSEMADIFSKELSTKVVHVSPSREEYKEQLAEMNVPGFLHDFLFQLYDTIAKGQWEKVCDDYTSLTGKKPTTFTQFVKENREIFSATTKPVEV